MSVDLYKGERFIIQFAVDARGACPARDFLEALRLEPQRIQEHAGLLRIIERFACFGTISNPEHFKMLQGVRPALMEFKRGQIRILAFFGAGDSSPGKGRVVLTHGFIKKSDKTPPTEIERAERIRREHLKTI